MSFERLREEIEKVIDEVGLPISDRNTLRGRLSKALTEMLSTHIDEFFTLELEKVIEILKLDLSSLAKAAILIDTNGLIKVRGDE